MFTDIRLQNFRSYGDASFEFGSGINIIVGPNGSGKTNLLEALLVVARGDSYRARDIELVKRGAGWARLDAHADSEARVVKIEKQNHLARKSFEVGGRVLQRLSLQKSMPVVLFEPNHLLLLTGSPDMRRNFLDEVIEQTMPGYATTRRLYRHILAQRNALLKKGLGHARAQVFVWNLRLSELGGKIASERLRLVEQINGLATEAYQGISRSDASVIVEYQSALRSDQYETDLLKRLEGGLEKDCLLGFTSAGPHRDDLRVHLGDWPANETASRGETRSLVLVLKIIELRLLSLVRDGDPPLLLLDDVFSELDGRRRHALTSHLRNYQTFITTTDADIVIKNFTRACNVIALGG